MDIWKRLDKAKVVHIDLDGTLCTGEAFTEEECLNAIPRLDVIRKVNKMFHKKYIVIWTARRNDLIGASITWLNKHAVLYNAIDNKKGATDLYIDDKCINIEDFMAETDRNYPDCIH